MNHTGLQLLEIDQAKKFIGKSIYELIDKEYRDAYRAMSDTVFKGGNACLEYKMVTFKDNQRWMRTNAVPFKNSNKQITNLITTTHDITEKMVFMQD